MAFSASVLLFIYSVGVSIKYKQYLYMLLGLGCVFAAYSMYFLTGNIYLVNRIFITNSVFVGFVAALFYMFFYHKHYLKIKISRRNDFFDHSSGTSSDKVNEPSFLYGLFTVSNGYR
ncbi:hypothetical protein HMSSN036_54170 [Paenibacillus macerans]|nr:hypothetical protein HMSSN036_54170 [Paenibacillus macerans]